MTKGNDELTLVRSWKICSSTMETETMTKQSVAMAQVGVFSREMEAESPAAIAQANKMMKERYFSCYLIMYEI